MKSRERKPSFFSAIFQTFWHSCGMAKAKKISREEMKKRIHAFCGIFKQRPGEKSVVQELLEERRAEKAKEDRE